MDFDKNSADLVYAANNLEDTEKLASWLANRATPDTVIALDGDLGAGKTAFSKLFAQHLGVQGTVNSPTFTLIKEYAGRLPFYHMDVYRLTLDEAEELGLDEYFYGGGVTLIEWASVVADILPQQLLHIYIESALGTTRKLYVTAFGDPYSQWVATLKENGVA